MSAALATLTACVGVCNLHPVVDSPSVDRLRDLPPADAGVRRGPAGGRAPRVESGTLTRRGRGPAALVDMGWRWGTTLVLLGCPSQPADAPSKTRQQLLPSFSEVTEAPLDQQPGHLEHSAIRFTFSALALAALADATSLPSVFRASLPAGTVVSGSVATLGDRAVHHRFHLSGQATSSLLAWGTSAALATVGDGRPALCDAVDAADTFCRGDSRSVVLGRSHATGVTFDLLRADPVTAELLGAARAAPLPAGETTSALAGHFGVDIDNERLRAMPSDPARDTSPLALPSLQIRGRAESRRLRARLRWSTHPENTLPWRARNARMSAPSVESWCGDSPCVVASTVPAPAQLRAVFPSRAPPPSGDLLWQRALLEEVAFAWPHTLAEHTQNPLDSPAGGFVAAAIETMGTIDAAGARWANASAEAFVRAPKPTVDLVAGLLAYVGTVQTVDAGSDRVSLATGSALPGPVFLALDDATADSDGWIALSPDAPAFAQLRKHAAVHYGPPWAYAVVPQLSLVAPQARAGLKSFRALGTVENEAFVLDIDADLNEAPVTVD